MNAVDKQRLARNNRLKFFTIVLIFALPFGLAWLYYQYGQAALPETINHGTLLVPPPDIRTFAFATEYQTAVPETERLGRWTLFYVTTSASCDERCEEGLFKMRQIRLATGKDQTRIFRVVLVLSAESTAPNTVPDKSFHRSIDSAFPGTALWLANQDAWEHLLSPPQPSADSIASPSDQFFIADPHGNLILSYPGTESGQAILKDMERLLKASKIG